MSAESLANTRMSVINGEREEAAKELMVAG